MLCGWNCALPPGGCEGDTSPRQPLFTLEGHQCAILDAAWCACGVLCSGAVRGEMIMWDLRLSAAEIEDPEEEGHVTAVLTEV